MDSRGHFKAVEREGKRGGREGKGRERKGRNGTGENTPKTNFWL